ncbi:mevalonate kinase [Candidatus Woesebacteria bacterium RIFOXYA1_FULL_40_18]|uniref:Mevalonate kinase n=1 Tax=Candidatus Woesebacteria bacterium RIFOXYA1_FULL_40_18 TaxID=1802532 RepID=A0A1F8CHB1_9BACT|nr:MAG: mevalonate kinase [Candidatus Woesebacteria bacterium RIFOXYA1_FULL_40_18]
MERVEVSAPGKLMLFGEHAVVYGRPCIVTAVDHRMRVAVEIADGDNLELYAPDVDVVGYVERMNNLGGKEAPKGTRFVSVAVRNFFNSFGIKSGLKIETRSDFSSEFGFGSSSAVTVGVIKALSEVFEKPLDNKKIFNLSYNTILDVQGVGSGFDVAAAIWGGTIYFVTGGKKIEPLAVSELPLVVGYTGVKADTPTLVRQVANFYEENKGLVGKIFDSVGDITKESRKALLKGDYKRLGKLMDENQVLLEKLRIGSPELSNLILAARKGGAYGAKLSGAGGGDCMIAFVPKDSAKLVEKTIEEKGGKIINVRTGARGVRLED